MDTVPCFLSICKGIQVLLSWTVILLKILGSYLFIYDWQSFWIFFVWCLVGAGDGGGEGEKVINKTGQNEAIFALGWLP